MNMGIQIQTGKMGFMAAMGQVPGLGPEAIQDGGLLGHRLLGKRWAELPNRCRVDDSNTDGPGLWQARVPGVSPRASSDLVCFSQCVTQIFSFSM